VVTGPTKSQRFALNDLAQATLSGTLMTRDPQLSPQELFIDFHVGCDLVYENGDGRMLSSTFLSVTSLNHRLFFSIMRLSLGGVESMWRKNSGLSRGRRVGRNSRKK
jgi:hypothetical protein